MSLLILNVMNRPANVIELEMKWCYREERVFGGLLQGYERINKIKSGFHHKMRAVRH